MFWFSQICVFFKIYLYFSKTISQNDYYWNFIYTVPVWKKKISQKLNKNKSLRHIL